jgi:hypothetical protein
MVWLGGIVMVLLEQSSLKRFRVESPATAPQVKAFQETNGKPERKQPTTPWQIKCCQKEARRE